MAPLIVMLAIQCPGLPIPSDLSLLRSRFGMLSARSMALIVVG